MTEVRQRLIDLYGHGADIEAVHASPAYVTLCQEYAGDRDFDREHCRVEELRQRIERYLARDTHKEQVQFALRLLTQLPDPADWETARELILLVHAHKWDPKQRTFFEERSLALPNMQHYFLSFTNRNPTKPNLNQVNRNHQFFIIDTLGPDAYSKANLSERNMLAEAIHYLLVNEQRKGFYYPQHEGDNTEVESKLKDNCERALAFVQLVQREMFKAYTGARNWCHFEYNVVHGRSADDVLFVQVDDVIDENYVDATYNTWYQAFAKKDPIKLAWTRWHTPEVIDRNRTSIARELTNQIDRAVNRIYKEIPD